MTLGGVFIPLKSISGFCFLWGAICQTLANIRLPMGWEMDDSVGQVLVAQREDLSSIPRTDIKMPGTVACACHPSAGGTETNGSLGITSHPAWSNQSRVSVGGPASKARWTGMQHSSLSFSIVTMKTHTYVRTHQKKIKGYQGGIGVPVMPENKERPKATDRNCSLF